MPETQLCGPAWSIYLFVQIAAETSLAASRTIDCLTSLPVQYHLEQAADLCHSPSFADGSGHNAELSSAGSMSVCTTSGMRSSEPLNRQRLFVVCHKVGLGLISLSRSTCNRPNCILFACSSVALPCQSTNSNLLPGGAGTRRQRRTCCGGCSARGRASSTWTSNGIALVVRMLGAISHLLRRLTISMSCAHQQRRYFRHACALPHSQLVSRRSGKPFLRSCQLIPNLGQSKGFCYVNYSSREAAAAAMDQLNGVEWPNASGARLKVHTPVLKAPLGHRLSVFEGQSWQATAKLRTMLMCHPAFWWHTDTVRRGLGFF